MHPSTLTSSLSSSSLSSVYQQCLRQHHTDLVSGIEPADIVDYLFQDDLLSVQDMERIPTFPTQAERMRHLLTIVHRRLISSDPDSVFRFFLSSISRHYSFLEAKLQDTLRTLLEEENLKHSAFISSQTPPKRCHTMPPRNGQVVTVVSPEEFAERSANAAATCEQPLNLNAVEENLPHPVMETTDGGWDNGSQSLKLCHSGIVHSTPSPSREYPSKTKVTHNFISSSVECRKNSNKLNEVQSRFSSEISELSVLAAAASPSDKVKSEECGRSIGGSAQVSLSPYRPPGARFQLEDLRSPGARFQLEDLRPLVMPPSNEGQRFKSRFHRKLFDFLSSSVNEQNYSGYDLAKVGLSSRAKRDPDTMCLILYLDACKGAILSNFDSCKRTIGESLEVAAYASSPNRFFAQILSVRIWINLKQRKMRKARLALTEALNVIGQDPVTCSGMIAGWIYMDEAKLLMASMTSSMRHVGAIRARAVKAMERALEQFKEDDTADGPYGINFASVKLASLLLACDDNLTLVGLLEPSEEDRSRADHLLTSVDDSSTGICSILKPLYLIALADQKFRAGILRRAVDLSYDARDRAQQSELCEEEELASIRCSCYSRLLQEAASGTSRSVPGLPGPIPLVCTSSSDDADVERTDDDDSNRDSKANTRCQPRKRKRRRRKEKRLPGGGVSLSLSNQKPFPCRRATPLWRIGFFLMTAVAFLTVACTMLFTTGLWGCLLRTM